MLAPWWQAVYSRIQSCNLRSVTASRGSADDGRRGNSSANGGVASSGLGRARDRDGGVLDGGQDGGVALGDGSDGVSRAGRGLSGGRDVAGGAGAGGGTAGGGGGLATPGGGGGRTSGGGSAASGNSDGAVAPGASVGGGDGADSGADSDGLGLDDGAVGGAVGHLRAARGNGLDLGAVDSGGGPWDGNGVGADAGNGLGVRRAVGDGLGAVVDGDELSEEVSAGLGNGSSGQDSSNGSVTHFEGRFGDEREGS